MKGWIFKVTHEASSSERLPNPMTCWVVADDLKIGDEKTIDVNRCARVSEIIWSGEPDFDLMAAKRKELGC